MCLGEQKQTASAWQTEASHKSSTQQAAAGAAEAVVDQTAADQNAVVVEGVAVDQTAAVVEGAVDQTELEASSSARELRIRVEEQQA